MQKQIEPEYNTLKLVDGGNYCIFWLMYILHDMFFVFPVVPKQRSLIKVI